MIVIIIRIFQTMVMCVDEVFSPPRGEGTCLIESTGDQICFGLGEMPSIHWGMLIRV